MNITPLRYTGNRRARIERLRRAMDTAPYGSDRRNAVKKALFRMLYTPDGGEVEVAGSRITRRFPPNMQWDGTVTGRIHLNHPNIQER